MAVSHVASTPTLIAISVVVRRRTPAIHALGPGCQIQVSRTWTIENGTLHVGDIVSMGKSIAGVAYKIPTANTKTKAILRESLSCRRDKTMRGRTSNAKSAAVFNALVEISAPFELIVHLP